MTALFHNLTKNIIKCFRGFNLLWHLLAIFLTYILVTTGFDWLYFTSFRSASVQSLLWPAVRIGGRVPIILPVALYISGKLSNNLKTTNTANALGQSVLIGLLICSFYKALTGRVHPPRLVAQNTIDISREFRFGLMRGGIFWGWPSSHTTIAFAMSIALLMLYPKNVVIKYLAVIYALYVGFGVSISIHWFSDFIAGSIIGTVIGVVVGKSFREHIAGKS
jgi:membrane-associated phospholipid phosphatase